MVQAGFEGNLLSCWDITSAPAKEIAAAKAGLYFWHPRADRSRSGLMGHKEVAASPCVFWKPGDSILELPSDKAEIVVGNARTAVFTVPTITHTTLVFTVRCATGLERHTFVVDSAASFRYLAISSGRSGLVDFCDFSL